MFSNVIFDWSGTLADDLAVVIAASNKVLNYYGKPSLSRTEFLANFSLPYWNFYDNIFGAGNYDPVQIDELYHRFFEAGRDSVPLLPQARNVLESLKKQGKKVFLLSSVKAEHFELQESHLGVRQFFDHFYLGAVDKITTMQLLLEKEGLDPEHTLMIGDMRHDIEAAKKNGVLAIALLTGYENAAQLAEASPDVVLPDLRVFNRLFC